MALAVAFDEARKNQLRSEGDGKDIKGGILSTRFFGSRDDPDSPFANLTRQDPGRYSRPHFHIVDQFQVIVDGKGRLGRHDLTPYSVHFSRAYTPYGPLVSGAGAGFTFFVMRAHPDPGSQSVSENEGKLKSVPDRRPWQITRRVAFPAFPAGTAAADTMLTAVPDMKDDRGLAAYSLNMKPNSRTYAPDPSHGDGQYLVVVKGSVLHDNKEHKAFALVFVWPKEGPFQIHAGSAGLEALILNFPRPQSGATPAAGTLQATTGLKRWQCGLCSFVYDEAAGMPEEGIAPGTRWQDVPDIWSCPDCSASKADFQMIALRN